MADMNTTPAELAQNRLAEARGILAMVRAAGTFDHIPDGNVVAALFGMEALLNQAQAALDDLVLGDDAVQLRVA